MLNRCSIFFLLLFAITVFISTLSGCGSTLKMQQVTVHKGGDTFKCTLQKEGLRVSVDPYFEQNRLQAYFGCDLLSRGVLPVLLVIENVSAEDGYMLVKEQTRLVYAPQHKDIKDIVGVGEPEGSQTTQQKIQTFEALRVGTAIVAPILIFAMAPIALVAEREVLNEGKIARNLEDKMIMGKPVYPGDSLYGFLYFKLGSKEEITNISHLQVHLNNIRTRQTLVFAVDTK